MLLVSIDAYSQIDSNNVHRIKTMQVSMFNAGQNISYYTQVAQTGLLMQVAGLGAVGVGVATINKNEASAKGAFILGGALSVIGMFVHLSSYKHMRKAGIHLMNNGISVDLPMKK